MPTLRQALTRNAAGGHQACPPPLHHQQLWNGFPERAGSGPPPDPPPWLLLRVVSPTLGLGTLASSVPIAAPLLQVREARALQQAPPPAAAWQQQQNQWSRAEQMRPSQAVPAVQGGWGGAQLTSRAQGVSQGPRRGLEPQLDSWAQQQLPAAAGQAEARLGNQQPVPLQWQHRQRHDWPATDGWQADISAPQPGRGWQGQQGALGGQAQEWGASSVLPQSSRSSSCRPEVSHTACGKPHHRMPNPQASAGQA